MELLFVTQNKNKLKEISAILPANISLLSLEDISFKEDIPEPYHTIQENAIHKARYIYNMYGINCFADDTGLEADALDGRPGVHSARYAGGNKSDKDNINKLLFELNGVENRDAQFRTIISLIINDNLHVFEGIVRGEIIKKRRGVSGFGYDPIFVPCGFEKTFAEMTLAEKNELSHRAKAIKKLCYFLNNL